VWDTAIRTSLYGTLLLLLLLPPLRAAGKQAGGADYDCSKGALRMPTRTLALELAPLRNNVNGLAPGRILTPFNQKAIDDPAFLEEQVQSIPFNRAAQPAEIARLALFLASSDADYVTGCRRSSWSRRRVIGE